jgi:mono/diheme cytochrome c family protein
MSNVFFARWIVAILALTAGSLSAAEKPVDFSRQVQPILAARCMKCHGPGKSEAGLAFDKPEHAFVDGESGLKAIVAGKPDESELIARITSEDDSTRMPPEGKPLKAEEIALIKRWVAEGAEWTKHWAYRPLQKPAVPLVAGNWGNNEIDAFILEGLESAGLEPSQPADRVALVRRAYYNLTGLPPTPEEVDAFVKDDSPQAWEQLIDKLLASERYGEHWGRKWLDVVRYAETNSFERDNPKPHVWRYRDYVIRSFNEDKPYDEFIKQQLAGDERPEPSADDLIATGFYRLGVWDDEPADRDLAMYEAYDDLVTTIGQGMLGLTFNCARCHDHKIDPIPAADYYKLVAFVRNLRPMQTNGPSIEEPIFVSPEARKAYDEALASRGAKINAVQAEITQLEKKFVAAFDTERVGVRDIEDLRYRYYRDTWDKIPDFDNLKAEDEGKLESGLLDISLATRDFSFGFVYTGTLKVPADGEYTFSLNSDDGSRLTIDGKVVVDYDGIHGQEAGPRSAKIALKHGRLPIRVDYFQGPTGAKGITLHWEGPEVPRRALSTDTNKRSKEIDITRLFKANGNEFVGEEVTKKYVALLAELEALKKDVPADRALVAKENGPTAADTFILLRGTPSNHGEKVSLGFPEIFETPAPVEPRPTAGDKSTGRRTVLANWIASPENRMTARVMANRIWQGHFGRGIVRSPNNFGGLGVPPTHPELLEYLATDLIEGGWKLKRLHKKIMLSAAYQQSSSGNSTGLAKDPANDLFWRYDLRRLSAEEVRDSFHAVDGRLNLTMYGPSVYPEIQKEVLQGQSVPGAGWGKSSPEDQARRSVYVHVKRSLITPLLASFDFPEPDTSCEARFTTTQPGQSFALLNSKFANDEAAEFAKRLKREAGDDTAAQIKLAYRLVTGREAKESDLARAREFIGKLQSKHQLSSDAAMQQFGLFMLNLNEFVYLD